MTNFEKMQYLEWLFLCEDENQIYSFDDDDVNEVKIMVGPKNYPNVRVIFQVIVHKDIDSITVSYQDTHNGVHMNNTYMAFDRTPYFALSNKPEMVEMIMKCIKEKKINTFTNTIANKEHPEDGDLFLAFRQKMEYGDDVEDD